jgi:predicted protein tyrosine phosphatase
MPTSSHPSIIIASRVEADSWSQHENLPICAVISITGAEDQPCLGFRRFEHKLQLHFEDIVPTESQSRAMSPRAPTREHASEIIRFAQQVQSMRGILLVHCTGGRSRSPAAATLCLATWLGPGAEIEVAREIFRMKPDCYPHRALIRFGDDLLGRDGQLARAIELTQTHPK